MQLNIFIAKSTIAINMSFLQ